MTWLLLVAAMICGLLALHPFVTYPLSLWCARRLMRQPLRPDAGPPPSVAICFCAYNEEGVIQQKAENLVALKRTTPSLEILAYLDGCSDRTEARLAPYADDITIIASRERHGKTYGMNQLVARTDAAVIVFTDATVMIDPAAIANLQKYFADPEVGCVCGVRRYSADPRSATATTGTIYWNLEELIKSLESETGSAIGADGSIFAIRRRLHRPVPPDITDDFFVSLSILCDGARIVRAPDVLAYEEAIGNAREEFRRKIRIGCHAFNVHRLLRPRLRQLSAWNKYKYVSHKLLRWVSVFNLAAAACLFTLWLVAVGYGMLALAMWLAFGVVALLGAWADIAPFNRAVSALAALIGTGYGVIKSLSGERFQTWSPAASIRNK